MRVSCLPPLVDEPRKRDGNNMWELGRRSETRWGNSLVEANYSFLVFKRLLRSQAWYDHAHPLRGCIPSTQVLAEGLDKTTLRSLASYSNTSAGLKAMQVQEARGASIGVTESQEEHRFYYDRPLTNWTEPAIARQATINCLGQTWGMRPPSF